MIPTIKKILFATDLSENARLAFSYAASEATRHGAQMVLIHVIEKTPDSVQAQLEGLFGAEKWHEMQEAQKRSARDIIIGKRTDYDLITQALADLCASANSGDSRCSFEAQEILVKQGAVAEEILKAAAERGCDLIVLGAHKGLLGKTSLGGVAKAVLHGAKVPVLVVPPAAA
ncbi:MAG: universal stress protein [Deferrisomatales bacterium]